MNFNEKRDYIGHIDQLFNVKEYILTGGRQQGVRAVSISNGAGLEITVLPDRCMDFYQIRYNGKNVSYIAPCGIRSPSLRGDFLDSFFAGFLTTCGLDNIGAPNEDDGEQLTLHGKLSLIPAEQVSVNIEIIDGVPTATIQGIMRQAALFGANLSLKRTIVCKYGENSITFTDEIINEGFRKMPMMILYHFNIGYPLLSEHATLHIPTENIIPLTQHAKDNVDSFNRITPPDFPYDEMCYYHDIEKQSDGTAVVGISNPEEDISLSIRYNRELLDHFVQL